MNYHSYYTPYFNATFKPKSSNGFVRLLHAVPDAPGVDIYGNNTLLAENLTFSNYTNYLSLAPGSYQITVYVTGTKENPVLTETTTIMSNMASTFVVGNTLSAISLYEITDGDVPLEYGKSMIRFAHFSPNAPAVDITLSDGTILFSDVTFGTTTDYEAVDSLNYTLQVRLAGTKTVVLTIPNVKLFPNMFYTLYAIGLVDSTPPLQSLKLRDRFIPIHYE